MLHPAFGVMRSEELVFIVANAPRRAIREPSIVDCIRRPSESGLPLQPFSIPASRTLDDSCCSRSKGTRQRLRHFDEWRVIRPSGLQRKMHTSTLAENVNTAFKNRPDDRTALPVFNAIHLNLN